MKSQDSLLYQLVRWKIDEQYPELTERLLLEDIHMPDLRHTIAMADLLDMSPSGGFSEYAEPGEDTSIVSRDRGLINRLHNYTKDKYLGYLKENTPLVVRERCSGLTDLEAGTVYFDFDAAGAKLAGESFHPNIAVITSELSARASMATPRTIICESDLPEVLAYMLPDEKPAIIISSYLAEHMNERQLRALIAHELLHCKEHGQKHVFSGIGTAFRGILTLNETLIREEYRADKHAVDLGCNAEDMIDALVFIHQRMSELKRFATTVDTLFKENGLDATDVLPTSFSAVLSYKDVKMRIFPEKSWVDYYRNNLKDPHPPTITRFDRLSALEDDDKTKRGR